LTCVMRWRMFRDKSRGETDSGESTKAVQWSQVGDTRDAWIGRLWGFA
jgi:hypothetical protein